MARGSLIPPEVFIAHSKKRTEARLVAIRERLKLQINIGNQSSNSATYTAQNARAAQAKRPR